METHTLPAIEEMTAAFQARDSSYDGIFYTGVKTTGIFCRPSCGARKPKPENLEFFATTRDALFSGYRPCKLCRPMRPLHEPPPWLNDLFELVGDDPATHVRDADLRRIGLDPGRVRRWFRRVHGMTFHAYDRARRLGRALEAMRQGENVTIAAFDNGFESLSGFNDAFARFAGTTPARSDGIATVSVRRLASPIGPLVAAATDDALVLLEFADRRMLEKQLSTITKRIPGALVPRTNPILDRVEDELEAYFAGDLREFTVPLHAPGTLFQERVWKELQTIPYGRTRSYLEQARRIGNPQAVRAVARANGDNRIAIVIPCHRVVGSDGKLTGYGGGLWRKKHLLALEERTSGRIS
ncbi:MAG: methylated-DNA--[protein]-cysteine S-methyltransferase [Gemmatimonadetes bacterium]|nr:methylated-DNA--[protein]-cysteine S-methyltransferase [Gemmatimonadota bacterium]